MKTVSPLEPVTPDLETPTTPPLSHQTKSRSLAITFVIFLGLVASMGVVILSMQKTQDTRSRATNSGPVLTMAPNTKTAAVGETFPIGVTMNTNSDKVSAAELHLTYDPSAIQITGFTEGTALPVKLVPETHTNGTISITLGSQPTSPFTGAGIVGTWNVKVLAAKQSSLSFTSATQVAAVGKTTNALASSTGTNITGTSATGAAPPTPTPMPTASSAHITPTTATTNTTSFGAIVQPTTTSVAFVRQPSQPTPTSASFQQTIPLPQTPTNTPPPIQTAPPTFLEQVITLISSFFKNLFGK